MLFYIRCLGKASLLERHLGDPRKYGSKPRDFSMMSASGTEKRQCQGPEVEAAVCVRNSNKASVAGKGGAMAKAAGDEVPE